MKNRPIFSYSQTGCGVFQSKSSNCKIASLTASECVVTARAREMYTGCGDFQIKSANDDGQSSLDGSEDDAVLGEEVRSQVIVCTDEGNVVLFSGVSGVFSTLDLRPRAHYEVHGDAEDTSSASDTTGQRFSFMRTPATASSTAPQTASAPPRAAVSKTFQSSRKEDDATGIGEVTEKIEELILASQTLPDVTTAIRELTNLAATQRVILTPSQLQTIKQGFCCVVCMKFIEEPVFTQFCQSLIGCKTCVEQWQETSVHCAKCRVNTADNNILEVHGLSEAFSVLRSLFDEE
ncbi:hypothetical protein F2P81_016520 [Scophthalmus maximus]|uniref:RING-type domain-containing protein n=1 Tax=Scophthalmus maximus TaxID=52904 RepID=A0A6A4SH80_SCOMX|nr:hypothetical protein F2P81_016520 [Scophthalmus maximus]